MNRGLFPRLSWAWVGEVALIVLVALLVKQLIRTHLAEWYLVPSSSMEPTLHGDPVNGDVVLVDKTAFWWRRPQRFELVVMRNPDDPERSHLVKRAVAFGSDDDHVVRVAEGDLFVGPARHALKRVVKTPAQARGLRIPHFVFPGPTDRPATAYFKSNDAWSIGTSDDSAPCIRVAAAGADLAALVAELDPLAAEARRRELPAGIYLPRHLSTALPVNTSFLDHQGQRRGAFEFDRDIGIEVEVVLEPGCTGIQLVLEQRGDYYAFGWSPSGHAQWSVNGKVQETLTTTSATQRVRLTWGYLDGGLFAEVNDQVCLRREYELRHDLGEARSPPLDNLLHVGVAGAPVRLPEVRVFHDVYYKALEGPFSGTSGPFEVPPRQMFLLGDNTFDSRDSRAGRMFSESDLVGRPIAVIKPRRRARWLRRCRSRWRPKSRHE